MANKTRNFLIGFFLLSSLTMLVALVMFLKPSTGNEEQTIVLRFSNVNQIGVGTRVSFAGKIVGEVSAIREIDRARETQPSDSLGRLFFYELTLKIDSRVSIYSTDEISVQTSGLLGEKSIAITPKTPPQGVASYRITSQNPFYADSMDPIGSTFSRLSEMGNKLDATANLVKAWCLQNEGRFSDAFSSFTSVMSQMNSLTEAMNQNRFISQLEEAAHAFTLSMKQMSQTLTSIRETNLFENLGTITSGLKNITSHQGTLGKLMQTDDLYLRFTAIMSKADTLMNDINHYGLMFHLNKGWQKTRTKLRSRLDSLESPSSFKDYFQSEVDRINTSMARISLLIEKAKQDEKPQVLQSTPFKENFAELLQLVDLMSSNLRLYNEQLSDTNPK